MATGVVASTTHSTVSNGASRQITGSIRLRTMSVGSATPLVSITISSGRGSRRSRTASVRSKSPCSEQQMQPLLRLTTPSAAPVISSASMLTAPKSLTTAAIRLPPACASRWFTTVVLPAPRNPATSTTGTDISAAGCGTTHRLAWPRCQIQHAVRDQRMAADHQVTHALRGTIHRREGRAVGERFEIECHDVGIRAYLQPALGAHGGRAGGENLCRNQRALADAFHQRPAPPLAHPLADEAGEATRRTRMRGGVVRQWPSVAGVNLAVRDRPGHGIRRDRAAGIEHRHIEEVAMVRVVLDIQDMPQHQRGGLGGLCRKQFLPVAEAPPVVHPLHRIVAGAIA